MRPGCCVPLTVTGCQAAGAHFFGFGKARLPPLCKAKGSNVQMLILYAHHIVPTDWRYPATPCTRGFLNFDAETIPGFDANKVYEDRTIAIDIQYRWYVKK
eukprot:2088396-Rhodomonas_salina.1